MGQKCSCFNEFGLSRLTGKRRRRTATADVPIESLAYIRNNQKYPPMPNLAPKTNPDVMMMSCRRHVHPNSENLKPEIKAAEVSGRGNSQSIQTPNFEIKDGTIILVPSQTDVSDTMSSLAAAIPCITSVGFRASENSSEEVTDKNYHHSLPYIPSNPKLTFLDNDTDILNEQNLDNRASVPGISARKHGIILNTTIDPSKSSGRDSKSPPEIPPRNFERYF